MGRCPRTMLKKSFFYLSVFIFFLFPAFSYAAEIDRILSLVDYIAGDYVNAVEEGRIINEFEYQGDAGLFFRSG